MINLDDYRERQKIHLSIMDIEGNIKEFRTYSKSDVDPVGMNIRNMVHPNDVHKLELASSMMDQGMEIELKFRVIGNSGKIHYFLSTFKPYGKDIIARELEVSREKWEKFTDRQLSVSKLRDYSDCARFWVCKEDLLKVKPNACRHCKQYEHRKIRANAPRYQYGTRYRSKDINWKGENHGRKTRPL